MTGGGGEEQGSEELSKVLERRGRVPSTLAVDWVMQACEALAALHAAGKVHGDLKPSNLVVAITAAGERMTVPSADAPKDEADASPRYMSPEQLTGATDIDARADIWALGVILFEMINGKPPFDAPTLPELTALILSRPAPLLTSLMPSISTRLSEIIARCLRADRQERFANLAELSAAIVPFGSDAARESTRGAARVGLPSERLMLSQRPEAVSSPNFAREDVPPSVSSSVLFGSGAPPSNRMTPEKPRRAWGRWLGIFGVAVVLIVLGLAMAATRDFGDEQDEGDKVEEPRPRKTPTKPPRSAEPPPPMAPLEP